jgi:hypothetical protein
LETYFLLFFVTGFDFVEGDHLSVYPLVIYCFVRVGEAEKSKGSAAESLAVEIEII